MNGFNNAQGFHLEQFASIATSIRFFLSFFDFAANLVDGKELFLATTRALGDLGPLTYFIISQAITHSSVLRWQLRLRLRRRT